MMFSGAFDFNSDLDQVSLCQQYEPDVLEASSSIKIFQDGMSQMLQI